MRADQPPASQPHRPASAPHAGAYIGYANLTPGEDSAHFGRVLDEVAKSLGPVDGLEWLIASDIVDETWQASRFRHAICVRMALARCDAVVDLLLKVQTWRDGDALPVGDAAHDIADKFMRSDASAREVVLGCLEAIGLEEQDLEAAATARALPDISQMQALISRSLDNRERLLRGLDRRRSSLAKRLRSSLKSLEAQSHDH